MVTVKENVPTKANATRMPDTTRYGRVRTTRQSCDLIHNFNDYEVVGLQSQSTGDIVLINPNTEVKRAFVPPSGMVIEKTDHPGNTIHARATDQGVKLMLTRETVSYPHEKNFVQARYDAVPLATAFEPNTIYVVEKDTLFELLAAYALDCRPLPAIFAIPEGEVCDNTGRIIGYESLTVFEPRRGEEVESLAMEDQLVFEL